MVDDLASDGPDVLSGPGAANEMPDDVVAAARAGAVQSVSPPAWLNKWVWHRSDYPDWLGFGRMCSVMWGDLRRAVVVHCADGRGFDPGRFGLRRRGRQER